MGKSKRDQAPKVTPKRKSTRRKASEPAVDVSALKRCVILCVDPAKKSGYALLVAGQVSDYGEVDIERWPAEPADVCSVARAKSRELNVPALLLVEKPFGGNAQGHEVGAWTNAWLRTGGRKNSVLKVIPGTWRSPALGKQWVGTKMVDGKRKGIERDAIKAEEVRVASEMVGKPVGFEAAAAICMTRYAVQSEVLWKKLPKRFVNPRPKKEPKAKRRKPADDDKLFGQFSGGGKSCAAAIDQGLMSPEEAELL